MPFKATAILPSKTILTLSSKDHRKHIIHIDDKLIESFDIEESTIWNLIIEDEYRDRGYGSCTLCLFSIVTIGVEISSNVHHWNKRSMRIHEKAGFSYNGGVHLINLKKPKDYTPTNLNFEYQIENYAP